MQEECIVEENAAGETLCDSVEGEGQDPRYIKRTDSNNDDSCRMHDFEVPPTKAKDAM